MNAAAPEGALPRLTGDFQKTPTSVPKETLKRKSFVNNTIFMDHECTRSVHIRFDNVNFFKDLPVKILIFTAKSDVKKIKQLKK